jgi:hypothetical protein
MSILSSTVKLPNWFPRVDYDDMFLLISYSYTTAVSSSNRFIIQDKKLQSFKKALNCMSIQSHFFV